MSNRTFDFIRQEIPGVILIKPRQFIDPRGAFEMSYQRSQFLEAGITQTFVQDNHSTSRRGVLRGLHYQIPPKAQGKLMRVVSGAALDVVVDIRRGSPTFGRHVAIELTAENRQLLWAPVGCAHGFLSLEDNVQLLYKVTEEYSPEHERGIRFDDPDLAIDWPLAPEEIVVNDRDRAFPALSKADLAFEFVS